MSYIPFHITIPDHNINHLLKQQQQQQQDQIIQLISGDIESTLKYLKKYNDFDIQYLSKNNDTYVSIIPKTCANLFKDNITPLTKIPIDIQRNMMISINNLQANLDQQVQSKIHIFIKVLCLHILKAKIITNVK